MHPETFTTHFRSVICFGGVRVIDDGAEEFNTLRILGERYNHNEQALTKKIKCGFNRLMMIEFNIEHMTGKEAIELVKEKLASP